MYGSHGFSPVPAVLSVQQATRPGVKEGSFLCLTVRPPDEDCLGCELFITRFQVRRRGVVKFIAFDKAYALNNFFFFFPASNRVIE